MFKPLPETSVATFSVLILSLIYSLNYKIILNYIIYPHSSWVTMANMEPFRGKLSKHDLESTFVPTLRQAIIDNNISTLKSAIKCGVDTNTIIEDGITLLKFALMINQTESAKFLLANGADVTRGDLWECVGLAVDQNNVEMLHMLLNAKVNPDFADPNSGGHTPMTKAVLHKNLKALRMLIAANCDVNKRGFVQRTPLHMACISVWKEGIEELLSHGANPLLEIETRKNVLSCAIEHGMGIDVIEQLLQACLKHVTSNDQKLTFLNSALVDAIIRNRCEMVKYLLKQGADSNSKLGRNMVTSLVPPLPAFCSSDSVLHLAVRHKNIQTIEHLIIAGADVNTCTINNVYPLHLAAMLPPDDKCSGSIILNLLIHAGADLQPVGYKLGLGIPTVGQLNDLFLRDHEKRPTPLAMALALQKYTIFLQLLDANCDPEFCLLTCLVDDLIAQSENDFEKGKYLTFLYNPNVLMIPPCLTEALIACGFPQNIIIGYLRELSTNLIPGQEKPFRELSKIFFSALPLKVLIRANIRRQVRLKNIPVKFSDTINKLNLPKALKEFLLFTDIWENFYNRPTWDS